MRAFLYSILLLLAFSACKKEDTPPAQTSPPVLPTLNQHPGNMIGRGSGMIVEADGSVILAGGMGSATQFLGRIIKFLPNGTVAWEKFYNSSDYFFAICKCNGGYLLAGSNSASSLDPGITLTKVDNNGDSTWFAFVNDVPSASEEVFGMTEGADGAIYIAGRSTPVGSLLGKFSANGDSVWTHFGTGSYAAVLTEGNAITLTGSNNGDLFLEQLDTSGTAAWHRDHLASLVQLPYSLRKTSDGGYVMTGDDYDPSNSDSKAFLMKRDASGNFAWNYLFAGDGKTYGWDAMETADGGFLIATSVYRPAGSFDALVIKVDASGQEVWKRYIDAGGQEYAYSLGVLPNGNFIMAGNSTIGTTVSTFLVKFDNTGFFF